MQNHVQDRLSGRKVAILGGGITGLTAAYYLLRRGADVTVFETMQQVGGLATYFDFGPFYWDRFYHCILTSDAPLLRLIDDLGLTPELRWEKTKVGFFTDGRLYSMSSNSDFVRFRPLSWWAKLRLGLGILYASRIRDGSSLEAILVSDWLIKVFGRENYVKMWEPLLRCKLGSCREEASAAFIWTTIARLYSTRDKSSRQEWLGYVRGGYRTVFTKLVDDIHCMGGQIHTGVTVHQLGHTVNGMVSIQSAAGHQPFDAAICTVPNRVAARLVPQLSQDYLVRLNTIKYLGIVCVVLVLKRRLSPYYCMNLTDEQLPFTGVIEMSNLISIEETNGYHLVYLPKYTAPDDPLFQAPDEEVWELFWPGLKKIVPDLHVEDIERRFTFRERLVQPLPVLHYSTFAPSIETGVPGIFLANTSQIVNSTLNNNEMVKIAKGAAEQTGQYLARKRAAHCQHEPAGASHADLLGSRTISQ